VYPKNGKSSFTLPNCQPQKRDNDKGSVEQAQTRESEETFAQSISVRDFEQEQRPEACGGGDGCDCGPSHPFGNVPKGPKGNAREVQDKTVEHSLIDRSLHLSKSERTKSPAPCSFTHCIKWENGKCLEENWKRDLEDSSHAPSDGINAGSPEQQRPSLVIHASPFAALQVENVAKDCRGKTGKLP
jgi:hypothetical protein